MKRQLSIKSFKPTLSRKIFGITVKDFLLLGLVIGVAAFFQSFPFLKIGYLKETGIKFSAFHDSLWHLALIKELARSIPPQQPGLSGIALKNYHYLTDLILMFIYKLTNISVIDLYFHIAAPLVSVLFSLGVYKLTKQLTQKHWVAVVAIIFTVFGGSFAYLIPIFLGKNTPWFANSFMLDQPYDQLTNVHTVLGFAVFLFATYYLMKFLDLKKNKYAITSGILFGLATGIKAYAAVVAVGALIATVIIEFTVRKKIKIIIPCIVSTSIFLLFTFINTSSKNPPLVWLPGWMLMKMVEDSGRFYNEQLSQLSYHYSEAGNILRLFQIYTYELLIYLIGNLGIRIFAFVWIIKKIKNIKVMKTSEIFIISSIFISLLIPLLFVQPISVYNTIQFSPYGLILLSILLVIWASKQNKKFALLFLLFLLSLPTTVKSFILSNKEQSEMPLAEYQVLNFVSSFPQESIILTPPGSKHQHFMVIPGIGGRRAYFSGDTFAQITDSPYQERINNQNHFFSLNSSNAFKEEFLKDAKITHIYSDEQNITDYLLKLQEKGFAIKDIYHQNQYSIFEVL